MRSAKVTKVDLEAWARGILGKEGRTPHQYRSSMAIKAALHSREAPEAPPSASRPPSMQRPPPSRRPSAVVDQSGVPSERRPSQAHAPRPSHSSSASRSSNRMPSTDMGSATRPGMHKAYTDTEHGPRYDGGPHYERSFSHSGGEDTIGIGLEESLPAHNGTGVRNGHR